MWAELSQASRCSLPLLPVLLSTHIHTLEATHLLSYSLPSASGSRGCYLVCSTLMFRRLLFVASCELWLSSLDQKQKCVFIKACRDYAGNLKKVIVLTYKRTSTQTHSPSWIVRLKELKWIPLNHNCHQIRQKSSPTHTRVQHWPQ